MTSIFLSIFYLTSSYQQQVVCDSIPRKEIVNFINWKIKSDNQSEVLIEVKNVNLNSVEWNSFDYEALDSISTILPNQELDHFKVHLGCYVNKKSTWSAIELEGVRLITPKLSYEIKRNEGYWSYSVPIFSSDNSYCITKYSYTCGELCLSLVISLFKKNKDGSWSFVKELWHIES